MNFTDRLVATGKRAGSLLCVGLDPEPANLTEPEAGADEEPTVEDDSLF